MPDGAATVRKGGNEGQSGRRLTLLSPDRYGGFFIDMPSDVSNCGDALQERPIFYCYYLIPGLNRWALHPGVDQLIAFWDWTRADKARMMRSTSVIE
ncbi:hypothetical protein [Caballeronia sp. LZ032]|uniref:hypothetical protein n=1 Tax=Caballeronia sp. LZ032 TaxID=3038565 RepID=UPI00286A8EE5|nr:hypothetical protein [Caballeronia sp. LZ032]